MSLNLPSISGETWLIADSGITIGVLIDGDRSAVIAREARSVCRERDEVGNWRPLMHDSAQH